MDNNPKVFNAYYDRVKASLGDKVSAIRPRPPILPAAYPNVPLDRRAILASIASKEVNKAQARVEPPGYSPEYPANDDDGQRAAAKAYTAAKQRFAQARQTGTPSQQAEAERQMVEAFFEARETPKRSGVRGA